MPKFEKFTRKSQEALAAAKELAELRDQHVIDSCGDFPAESGADSRDRCNTS